jgi:hypothetical protein
MATPIPSLSRNPAAICCAVATSSGEVVLGIEPSGGEDQPIELDATVVDAAPLSVHVSPGLGVNGRGSAATLWWCSLGEHLAERIDDGDHSEDAGAYFEALLDGRPGRHRGVPFVFVEPTVDRFDDDRPAAITGQGEAQPSRRSSGQLAPVRQCDSTGVTSAGPESGIRAVAGARARR